MFGPTSRYTRSANLVFLTNDGRTVAYLERRFAPPGATLPTLVELPIDDSNHGRLDLIASEQIGDPRSFWRICDKNDTMNPFDLAEDRGRVILVPIPQP